MSDDIKKKPNKTGVKFTFYQRHHNEDADPFILSKKGNEALLVCDGLGGAGNTEHEVEGKLSYDDLKKVIVPEVLVPEEKQNKNHRILNSYFEELFKPIEENPSGHTSALWASRIVATRYIYRLLFDKNSIKNNKEAFKNNFIDDVYTTLHKVAKAFNLTVKGLKGIILLPTTFVSLVVTEETEKEVTVEALWAGDSRAYVLTKQGLFQLSKDNEDEASGGINNLFYAHDGSEEEKAKLYNRTYTFKKPLALMCVSDGIFDNKEYVDVENIFLSNLMISNDIDEYRDILDKYYEETKTDDCTVAFKIYGSSFDEFKNLLKKRSNEISRIIKNRNKYEEIKELKENPGKYDDYYNKLVARTKVRIDMIISKIVDSFKLNDGNSFVKAIVPNYTDLTAPNLALAKDNSPVFRKLKNRILHAIDDVLDKNQKKIPDPKCIDLRNIFDLGSRLKEYEGIFNSYMECVNSLEEMGNLQREYEEIFKNHVNPLYESLITEYRKLVHIQVAPSSRTTVEELSSKDSIYLYLALPKVNSIDIIGTFPNRDLNENSFMIFNLLDKDIVKRICDINKKMFELNDEFKNKKNDVIDMYKAFVNEFFKSSSNYLTMSLKDNLDTNEFADLEGIKTSLEALKQPKKVDIVAILTEEYKSEAGYIKLINLRLDMGDVSTPIDSIYNESLLKNTLKYHRLRNTSAEGFDEFYEGYNEYNKTALKYIEE